MDFMASAYGMGRLGSSLLTLDFVNLGLLSLMRGFAHIDLTLLIYGMSRLGPSISCLDFIHLDLAMLLHGFVKRA